jgi:hypothetical protein
MGSIAYVNNVSTEIDMVISMSSFFRGHEDDEASLLWCSKGEVAENW